ncbi:MAG: hypothetical protein ACYC8T_17445 [Myxococcaceae bacterium]
MIARALRVLPVLLLGLTGCGHKKLPPPIEQKLTLGGNVATYRDYRKGVVCDMEPHRLESDLDSMNALLVSFLGQTSASREGMWADEHVSLLEGAVQALPAALDGHESALSGMRRCKFDTKADLGETARKGEELARQSRKRLADAPGLLTWLNAKRAVEKWREAQPAAQQAGREEWCPPSPRPGAPDLFYASAEGGQTRWYFCDGSLVTAEGASPPQFLGSPAEGKKAKKPQPKPYLEAAAKYPSSEVQRPPPMPAP